MQKPQAIDKGYRGYKGSGTYYWLRSRPDWALAQDNKDSLIFLRASMLPATKTAFCMKKRFSRDELGKFQGKLAMQL